ncbi:MAG TPA: hypothetical protein EYP98_04260, partial [Planctomycetes bacterium]|nr:hypothetical protein [Planctomycetota bacterium]
MAQFVEFIELHFPSPVCFGARGAAKPGTDVYGQVVEPDSGPFAAKVWKVVSDPYVGRLTYMRAFRGELKKDETLVDTRTGESHKIGHLHRFQGTE